MIVYILGGNIVSLYTCSWDSYLLWSSGDMYAIQVLYVTVLCPHAVFFDYNTSRTYEHMKYRSVNAFAKLTWKQIIPGNLPLSGVYIQDANSTSMFVTYQSVLPS